MLTSQVSRYFTFLFFLMTFSVNGVVEAAERTFATAAVYSPPECILPTATHPYRNDTFELILAEDYDQLDGPALTESIDALKRRGAHRCWHKHSTFLEHLIGVHNMLRLWGQGENVLVLSLQLVILIRI